MPPQGTASRLLAPHLPDLPAQHHGRKRPQPSADDGAVRALIAARIVGTVRRETSLANSPACRLASRSEYRLTTPCPPFRASQRQPRSGRSSSRLTDRLTASHLRRKGCSKSRRDVSVRLGTSPRVSQFDRAHQDLGDPAGDTGSPRPSKPAHRSAAEPGSGTGTTGVTAEPGVAVNSVPTLLESCVVNVPWVVSVVPMNGGIADRDRFCCKCRQQIGIGGQGGHRGPGVAHTVTRGELNCVAAKDKAQRHRRGKCCRRQAADRDRQAAQWNRREAAIVNNSVGPG